MFAISTRDTKISLNETNAVYIALTLRSVQNNLGEIVARDILDVNTGDLTQEVKQIESVAKNTVVDYQDMADGGWFNAYGDDEIVQIGQKGDVVTVENATLTYQLAQPIETNVPAQMITAGPQHTFMWLPEVADAGIYGDDGIAILREELPIKELKKLSKIDFYTGEEISLNLSAAIIAEDKKSFTHPDLTKDDIVFFVYEYPSELSTVPEMEVEYYDSRYVVQDTENGKMYTWKIVSNNGVASIQLTEVA
jgi:hypothetical protein